ncbi:MAG: prepilin-type N-terminal cleavage/methylation domain-containing protein [Candidatus Zixiibacteriota bacterium]|nr:MAG: prepilin-type N-terminal cleavage/methylation domain-containing protein [candidate division Zixibacteria bacterium]
MNRMIAKIHETRGATLLEVLIALAITGIVTASIMQLYVTQHTNYLTQDDITTIQQNARASIDELTRNIRMAGRQLPAGLQALQASNTNPDTLTVVYKAGNCDTYLSSPMPLPSAELKCGNDISCFGEGQWVYIYEPDSGIGEWFEITEVQAAAFHIQHNTMTLSRCYGADALVLAVDQVKFYIDDLTDPEHPCLMVQPIGMPPQVYAEDIVDLQFQYHLTNGMVVDEPVLVEDIREVIISVTARSKKPNTENKDEPYRTRTFSSSVNLRNIRS